MPKVNPQTGEVLIGEDIAQGLQEGRQRQREGEFAQYLQKQGLAPGAEAPIPEGTGPEFMNFMKAGGLKGYQEEQIAHQQGQALGGIAHQMAADPNVSPDLQMRAKAYGDAFKSGGVRGPASIELLKELQMQHRLELNAKQMEGVKSGIIPESLDDERGVQEIKLSTDAQGFIKKSVGEASSPKQFNAHGDRATRLGMKHAMGIPLTPQETFQYNRSKNLVNNWRPELRTPDMMQFTRFPELSELGKPNTSMVKPGEPVQSGNLVPQAGQPGAQDGQTVTKYQPDPERIPYAHTDYKGPYQVFMPPAPQPVPGQIGERITKPAPVAETDKIRDQEFAVNSMRNMSDAIEKLSMDDRARLGVAMKEVLAGIPIIGRFSQAVTALALSPEMSAIQTHMGHSQVRYENAMGGVRAAGSPQMYPIFQAIMGNLSDVNAPTKLRALASDLQTAALIGQRDMVVQRYQGMPLHFRPERAPGQKAVRQTFGGGTQPATQRPIKGSAGVTGTSMNRPPLTQFQR
jgi:hypothetical protein